MTPATLTRDETSLHHQTTAAVLAGRDLFKTYGTGDVAVHALDGVSLTIDHGELVAVMGPSGSGKSTLMHILAGLDRPTSGQAWIGDDEISTLNDDRLTDIRRRHVGFIFQSFNLLPMLSAKENIQLPARIAGRKVDTAWFDGLVERVGLGDRLGHRPSELSGGQQQRVAIARALVGRPTVLFADEPTGNLDTHSGTQVLELIREAVERDRQTTVMVTHDPRAAAIADRVLFLADGQIVTTLDSPSRDSVIATLAEVTDR
jgi:putative ABC transport system ATP-binding protein